MVLLELPNLCSDQLGNLAGVRDLPLNLKLPSADNGAKQEGSMTIRYEAVKNIRKM